jgi:hypothetical protein
VFRNELGQSYDMSRVFATVVIGHSDHHRPAQVPREVVARTLRQYNAGLDRVEVITYDQLVDSAERPLDFQHDPKNGSPASAPATVPRRSPQAADLTDLAPSTALWDDSEPPF